MQASRVSRKGVLHCDGSESNNMRCFDIGFPQIAASSSGLRAPRRNEASGHIATRARVSPTVPPRISASALSQK